MPAGVQTGWSLEGLPKAYPEEPHHKSIDLKENLTINENNINLLVILIMIAIDILLYMALSWYIDQLKPGSYGVPQPYNFCFLRSYWRPQKSTFDVNNQVASTAQLQENFEAVPRNLKVGVSIQHVSKVFKLPNRSLKTAVDNVTLDFYRGEISGLLGHNGAGKSTLFSMISGLSYPTSGKVIINGYDITVNLKKARKSLGLCPQQDMLYNDLTAVQIIKFFGVIKGLSYNKAKKEANDLIRVLKLNRVKNTRSGNLSGGQKRKVSLAIALIGGSEVLLLDEPSSGMDPEIRREIWEILLKLRGSRTIVLTTHFMEEADALCDRIAILDHGKIRCYGTPMYLKSKFGKGYVLSVVVLDVDKIKSVVDYVKQVATGKLKSQNVRTLTFEIPEKEVKVFPILLSGLEEKQKKNEIASYAVSLSALEDVFLRFSGGPDEAEAIEISGFKVQGRSGNEGMPKKQILFLCWFQIRALIYKKWISICRSYISFFMYCMFSVFLLLLVAILSNSKGFKKNSGGEMLTVSLDLYSSSLVLFSKIEDEPKKKTFKDLVDSFGSKTEEVSDSQKALVKYFNSDFYTYAKKIIMGVDYSPSELKLFYNERGIYLVPASLNFIHNFLLKSSKEGFKIVTSLNSQYAEKEEVSSEKSSECRPRSLTDFMGLQTMFYLLGPLREKIFGAKDIQLMITAATLYWFTHLIFDLTTFFIFVMIVYVVLGLAVNDRAMFQYAGYAFGSYVFWGAGLLLFGYLISTFVKSAPVAFTINITVYILSCFILYNAMYFSLISEKFQYIHSSCIVKLGLTDVCAGKKSNVILKLVIFDFVLFLILILTDSKCLERFFYCIFGRMVKVKYSDQELKDDFVREEEETVRRVISRDTSETALIADNIKRWFCRSCKTFPAVQGISFAVSRGECFGLLGVNGAGKTSTFKMLTGSIPATSGHIYICSKKVHFFNRKKNLFLIGYCPQYGGLIPSFKGIELLKFFGRLKGVRPANIDQEVHKWLEKVNLLEWKNQKCGNYSGGNQRKLSTAIALIGNPPLVFLDEPTSGVDPASRRVIWNAVEYIQKQGQSVVLTSHSMDECEALCSRLAIMVSGKFRCIGEITTLKSRFGQGFCIEFKLSADPNLQNLDVLKKAIVSTFEPECDLVDEHLTILQYHIKNKNITWSDVFSKLQALKKSYPVIESYVASSTTLEQVFIYFAKNK